MVVFCPRVGVRFEPEYLELGLERNYIQLVLVTALIILVFLNI